MKNELTTKQRVFVEEYIRTKNATEAARRAGYRGSRRTLAAIGSENLAKDYIQADVAKRVKELQLTTGVKPKKVRNISFWVYLIQAENGYVKIGIASNPQERLTILDTASPLKLKMLFCFQSLFAREVEANLHQQYDAKRVKGEWFDLDSADIEEIWRGHVKTNR